jgi:hypothetical protein
MKGKARVAEPTISGPHAGAPPSGPMLMPEGVTGLEGKEGARDLGQAETASVTAAEAAEVEARLREMQDSQRALAKERGDHPKPIGPGGGGGRGGDGIDTVKDPFAGEKLDYKPVDRDPTTIVTTDRGGGEDGKFTAGTDRTGGAVSGSATTGAVRGGTGVGTQIDGHVGTPPRPPPDTTEIATGDDDNRDEEAEPEGTGGSPETTGVRSPKPPPPTKRQQAENLHRQARGAASKKNCPVAKTMAKKAKELDADYYAKNIAPDAALKDCL